MRRNSESSRNQESLADTTRDPSWIRCHTALGATAGERTGGRRRVALGDVAQLLRLGEGAELLQRVVLDLADPLACDVEQASDLVERPRLLAVQSVAHLEHPALALREHPERAPQRLVAEREGGGLVGKRLGLVLDEVAELRFLLVADRLLQRDGRLRRPPDLLDVLGAEVELESDLLRGRLAAALGAE